VGSAQRADDEYDDTRCDHHESGCPHLFGLEGARHAGAPGAGYRSDSQRDRSYPTERLDPRQQDNDASVYSGKAERLRPPVHNDLLSGSDDGVAAEEPLRCAPLEANWGRLSDGDVKTVTVLIIPPGVKALDMNTSFDVQCRMD
jgi:hypothetical protein